jgi:hypothetical protein
LLLFITVFLSHYHLVPPPPPPPVPPVIIDVPGKEYLLKRKLVIEKFKPSEIPGDIKIYDW